MESLANQRELFSEPPRQKGSVVVWRVVRIKPALLYRCRVCTQNLVWVPTHFYRGRSVPCVGEGCRVCPEVAARWYAYVPSVFVKDGKLGGTAVVELPIGAALNLGELVERHVHDGEHSWLGVEFEAKRTKRTMRSPVSCQLVAVRESVVERDLDEVLESLCRMWGIPRFDDATDMDVWKELVSIRVSSSEHYVKKNGTPEGR